MLGEVGGSCSFDAMIKISKRRWLVAPTIPITSLSAPSKPTKSRAKLRLKCSAMLMNFGDKFSKAEVDDIFGEFEVDDDGFIESKAVIGLFVAGGGEEKKEEEKKEEAAPEGGEGGDAGDAGGDDAGGKKKKKKKKAAK